MILSALVLLSGGIFWAEADTIEKPTFKLTKVGPIDQDNGFPVWYKDDDTRLQLCLDVNDPYCALLPEEIPNPDAPISLKNNNFPEEAFYQLAGSVIDNLPNDGRAVGTFALEAAFGNGLPVDGDQIVFGRVRFRIDGLVTGQKYKITHPYGVDELVATAADDKDPANGEIRFVEDIGLSGGFSAAMNSRIGSFLEWDEGAPEGYVGDPNVDHKIKGGYKNYFMIEGVGVGADAAADNKCVGSDGIEANCIKTDLFSLMGKKATTAGVDVVRATYSRNLDNEGNPIDGGTVDVFAFTEEDQAYKIDVTQEGAEDKSIRMRGSKGKYFARIPFTGDKPKKLTITNVSDKPNSIKTKVPVDKVTGEATATYNDQTFTITVKADSSDKVNKPTLTVDGFEGTITENGLTINSSYLPSDLTIHSTAGGSVTIPVDVTGEASSPPVANAGDPITVVAGETVTLDGSKSTGTFDQIVWEQISPQEPKVVLEKPNELVTSFTAQTGMGDLDFQLTLKNSKGEESTSTVKVTVKDAMPPLPVAIVGPNQQVAQGTDVTLDGSASTDALTYTWKQTQGPQVNLDLANPAKPTFKFPKQFTTLEFSLTVTGKGGTSAPVTVQITTVKDKLTAQPAEYRTRISTWRLDGTSDVFGPGVKVTIYLVDPNKNEKVLGTADVDTLGAFRFRDIGPSFVAGSTLKIVSSSGGMLENVSIVRK